MGIACALTATLLHVAPARATCESRVAKWSEACEPARVHCVRPVLCPPRRVIVSTGCDADSQVNVEIGPDTPGSFRHVDGLGVSPVGSFADWLEEPQARRDAFEAVVTCLQKDPTLWDDGAGHDPTTGPHAGTGAPAGGRLPVPWLFLLGVVGFAAVLVVRLRTTPELLTRNELLGLAALTVGTVLARALILTPAFFHHNGQGPLWIAIALDPRGYESHYGPGYWELFRAVALWGGASPEKAIFWTQAAWSALIPPCVWLVVRTLGGRRFWPWLFAGAATLSPVLARVAESESYYAAWLVLLFLAATALALGWVSVTHRVLAGLASVTAALCIAQAARVIPVGWVPAATVPLVLFVAPGPLRTRVRAMLVATAVIAVVVAATSGVAMWQVISGYLGRVWLPTLGKQAATFPWYALAAAAPLAFLVWASPRRQPAAVVAGVVFVLFIVANATHLVRGEASWVSHAYLALWTPVWLAGLARLVVDIAPSQLSRAVQLAAIVLVASAHIWTYREDTQLPTDAREAAWALDWRQQVPAGATLVYFSHAQRSVTVLPVYGIGSAVPVESRVLGPGQPVPTLASLTPPVYYYRSSLCSTDEAGDTCTAFEAQFGLELLTEKTLPAIPSMPGQHYEQSQVRVALYRVVGEKAQN